MRYLRIALFLALAGSAPAFADDCWIVSNLHGYTAADSDAYRFSEDGIGHAILICFTADGGSVSGTDIPLVKFGNSTLAGYSGNEAGLEAFEVYQLDRNNEKLLFTRTRIGTRTVTSALPDLMSAFVGDAVRADR